MIKEAADRFFKWYCHPEYYDDIRGDLEELYRQRLKETAKSDADWYYVKEVLLLLRLSIIRPFIFNHPAMIQNNLKIALRHLWSQKFYSTIKIGGFALGIAAFVLLVIYLQHEWSYDNFYPKKDRIYRVTTHFLKEGFRGVDYPAPFSKVLVDEFPEIEQAGRYIPITWFDQVRPSDRQQNTFEEKTMAYIDRDLLSILDLPMVEGDYAKSMNEPNTVVISASKAKQLFRNRDAIDQLLIINDNEDRPYKVVGVFQDFPSNSHLQFDYFISLAGVEFWPGEQDYWGANMYDVYALIHPDADVTALNEKLSSITTNYLVPSWTERDFADPEDMARNLSYELQPIQNIYLDAEGMRDRLPHGDQRLFWLFAFAGLLIIAIASINFINLSVANYSVRAKEVGLRKVIGATRKQIANQFLSESILYSFISFVVGIALAYLLLPSINEIIGKTLEFPWQIQRGLPMVLAGIITLGLLTGAYPSLYLSALNPLSKEQGKPSKSKAQSGLVVFQFIISAALIICTIVVYQQMQFILGKDLGFDKEQVLAIRGTNSLGTKMPVFKEKLLELKDVKSVSVSGYLPIEGSQRYSDSFWKNGRQSIDQGVNAQIWQVDPDYLETLGLRLLEGRGFQSNLSADSSAIIVSKSLAEQLVLDENIGTTITNKEHTWNIIGVMEDFHFESLKTEVSPSCLVLGNSPSVVTVKMNADRADQLLASIGSIWREMVPGNAFRYNFLDESFAAMHEDVRRSGTLFTAFSLLALVIAGLGLFGLTTFVIKQRSKEIGIRKVLGASVANIVSLLSRDFLRLVFIGTLIAVPLGWYVMNQWLEGFAYRVDLRWWMFGLSVFITCLLALATTGIQSIRSALANPVDSIRH